MQPCTFWIKTKFHTVQLLLNSQYFKLKKYTKFNGFTFNIIMQNFRNYFHNLDFSPPKYSKVLDSRDVVSIISTNSIISSMFLQPKFMRQLQWVPYLLSNQLSVHIWSSFLRIKLASNRELFKDGSPKIWTSKIAYWWPYWNVHFDASAYSSTNTRRKSDKFASVNKHIGRHFFLWFHCLCHFVCHFFCDWAR